MIRILTGDCRDVLPTLEAGSVHCVVTSPPYYALRDYGTAQWQGGDAGCDHKQKPEKRGNASYTNGQGGSFASNLQAWGDRDVSSNYRITCGKCGARRIDRQIGLEATPDEYIQTMVEVFRELRRVLRDDGTVWCNMGDSFSSKQLLMMPARLALALQADGWWLRSDIIWAKPNPMPESVTDRPTSAHEHVFLLTKRSRYFYDSEAVREPVEEPWRSTGRLEQRGSKDVLAGVNQGFGLDGIRPRLYNPAGRSCRNVWTIATAPFPAAHFATFPPELAERCIRAGTSERGCCAQCGKPWVRVVQRAVVGDWRSSDRARDLEDGAKGGPGGIMPGWEPPRTTGWSPGCTCDLQDGNKAYPDPPIPCTVLDPFSGAGTSGLVADRLGRDAVMIDLNHQYVEMARERLQRDCPLFADITDAPVPEPPEDERMVDLFAEVAD